MPQMLAFNPESAFRSIVSRMINEGVFVRESYDDLVEEVIEEMRENGEIDEDDDTQNYIEELRARWPEAEAMISSGHDRDILEE